VHVADPVKEYILDLVAATRESPDVRHGASPRAALGFISTAKGRAAIHGREYVIPDDVKTLGHPCYATGSFGQQMQSCLKRLSQRS